MKNNNKGFTLIELLAAITILGILMGVALPAIMRVIDKSRSKMYIADAKKFISTVEYQVRSGKVSKPGPGGYTVVSLNYLKSSDFNNPPNGGEYLGNSYVVISNDSGNLVYKVTLVEKTKSGDFKGLFPAYKVNSLGNKNKAIMTEAVLDGDEHIKYNDAKYEYIKQLNQAKTNEDFNALKPVQLIQSTSTSPLANISNSSCIYSGARCLVEP